MSEKDFLKDYLNNEVKDFLFTELNTDFLENNGFDCLVGVPVPIKQSDLQDFTKNGLSTTKIADNMAVVIGGDTEFKYKDAYLRFLNKLFDRKVVLVFVSKAEDLLKKECYRQAMCYLRAAIALDPDGKESVYCYANGCRLWYQSMEGEDFQELIAYLKGEANGNFARLTNLYPDFAPAWYYLGYAYLNLGAYEKAEISFKHYMANSEGMPEDDIKEVTDRLEELKDPVIVEKAKTMLTLGHFQEALDVFIPYAEGKFSTWWPIHYYMAVAYENLEKVEDALKCYLKVLELCPSNYDACVAVSELYQALGDEEKARKYSMKAQIITENSKNDNSN